MSEKKNKIDFWAVGDIVIDAFIKLKDAHVHCRIDTDACELCVRFGDKVPYESVTVVPAVGNSPNAAVAACSTPELVKIRIILVVSLFETSAVEDTI